MRFALGLLLAQSLTQKAGVMFRVLLKVFNRHTIITKMRISGKLGVFVDDLLRRTAHFSIGAGAVEKPGLRCSPLERLRFDLFRERDLDDLILAVF